MFFRMVIVSFVFFNLRACLCIRWDAFSVKTLYEWSHAATDVIDNEAINALLGDNVCEVIHVNGVFRHGARNPSVQEMINIEELHKKIVEIQPNSKLDSWKSKFNKDMGSELVLKGASAQLGLGRRFGKRFNKFLKNNGQYLKFVSSSKSRAIDSSRYFHAGLIKLIPDIAKHENDINDETTRFYDGCKKYEEQVKDNTEFEMFQKTKEFIRVTQSLNDRLGHNITFLPSDVYLLYEMCAYGKYINEDMLWCQLMTDEEREILEFGRDVQKYYEASYGLTINSKMVCPLVRDMFLTMDNAMNDTWDYSNIGNDAHLFGYTAAKLQFGHWVTVLPLMTALGLFQDSVPLQAYNMTAEKHRLFKTSHISPFSSNVVFALYACDDGNSSELSSTTKSRQYAVRLFVNEDPVIIPACNRSVCRYEEVREAYSNWIENCNIEEVCDSGDKDTSERVDVDSEAITLKCDILVLLVSSIFYMVDVTRSTL